MGPMDLKKLSEPRKAQDIREEDKVDNSDFGYMKKARAEKKEETDEMIQFKLRAENDKKILV